MKTYRTLHVRKGFTILEAMMAMFILVIASSGILMSFTAAASVQAEGQRRVIASRLAADLLERVNATNYTQVISTWNGYTEAAASLKDNSGAVITDSAYAGLSRSVACSTTTVAGVNLILATVTVYYNGAETATLSTLIGDQYKH